MRYQSKHTENETNVFFIHNSYNKTGNCTCKVTLRRVYVTIVAVKKPKSTTYSECVLVALGIQHAMRMHRVTLSAVACPALQ